MLLKPLRSSTFTFVFYVLVLFVLLFFGEGNRIPWTFSPYSFLFSLLQYKISSDNPKLRTANSDFERVSQLREWVFLHIPKGSRSVDISSKFYKKNPVQILFIANSGRGGASCEGMAYALMRLYQSYGYESYTYHVGKKERFSHVVTLVKVNHKGTVRFVVQDAFYNLTYVDNKGDPLDFDSLERLIRSKKITKENILYGKAKTHTYVCYLKDGCGHPDEVKAVELRDGILRYKEQVTRQDVVKNLNMFLTPGCISYYGNIGVNPSFKSFLHQSQVCN